MLRTILRITILLGVLSTTSLAAQIAPRPSVTAPEVVALGRGEARLRADRATLVLAVVTRAATAALAGRLNAERVGPVLSALQRLGLPDSALSTSGYTVDLEEPEDPQPARSTRTREYVARNAIRIAVPRLEMLGTIVDSALAAGATEAGDITLESSVASEGRRRAIAAATLDARADAAAAAIALGGSIGRTIEVEVDPSGFRLASGQLMRLESVVVTGARGRVLPTVLLPRELTVTVQVRLRAELQPAAP